MYIASVMTYKTKTYSGPEGVRSVMTNPPQVFLISNMITFTEHSLTATAVAQLETGKLDFYDIQNEHLKIAERKRLSAAKWQKTRSIILKIGSKTKIILFA